MPSQFPDRLRITPVALGVRVPLPGSDVLPFFATSGRVFSTSREASSVVHAEVFIAEIPSNSGPSWYQHTVNFPDFTVLGDEENPGEATGWQLREIIKDGDRTWACYVNTFGNAPEGV